MRFPRLVAVAWLMLLCAAGTAQAQRRVALVVGNAAYSHADVLENPVNDARDMRDALKGLGFEVVYGEDLDQKAMRRTIGHFARAVSDAAVALVYFAGHGATFGDTPYVVPVDAEFSSLEQVPYEMISLETLIGELRRVQGVRIAIIDACRDDAAERELKRRAIGTRGGELIRGLAPMKNPQGLILAYATQYLSTAADVAGVNSPFTAALLHNIATPGLDIKDLFFRVGQEVVTTTGNQQRPEISISIYEPFTLVPAAARPDGPPAATTPPEALPPVPVATAPTPSQPTTPVPTTPVPTAPVPDAPPVVAPVTPAPVPVATVPPPTAADAAATVAPSPQDETRPAAEPRRPNPPGGRRRTVASSERPRREHWRDREAEPVRRNLPPPPIINDCTHVAFPQCGRSMR